MAHHFKAQDIIITTARTRGIPSYNVTFVNCETAAKITMRIPKLGIYDDPESTHELTYGEVMALAIEIAGVLREELQEPSQFKKPKRPKRPIRPKK